jgi:hypothetical protein
MRIGTLLRLLPIALALAVAIAGCGSSSSEDTSSTPSGLGPPGEATSSTAPSGVSTKGCKDDSLDPPEIVVIGGSCAEGRRTVAAWGQNDSCKVAKNASHSSCTVGKLRCIGTVTDRGLLVNCARPARSISFVEPT